MSDKPKIMIGSVDVTEHVGAMYDALITSMDWGSGFLHDDEIDALLIIGELAGFDVPEDARRQHPKLIDGWIAEAKAKAEALKADQHTDR